MTYDDTNDPTEERLRAMARSYNAPGETPRERMWQRIQAERKRAATPVRVGRWRYAAGGLAAAAVLLVGIAIGRMSADRHGARQAAVAIVDAPRRQPVADTARTIAPTPAAPIGDSAVRRPTRQLAARGGRAGHQDTAIDRARSTRPAPSDRPDIGYRLAVLDHLAGTEAMITSFRAEARRGRVDAQVTSWARDLLGTTRMLQASDAARDPVMRRLLDDLELVLAQIAQYDSRPGGRARSEELDLIEHSIERRGVIARMRTTIPASPSPAGT